MEIILIDDIKNVQTFKSGYELVEYEKGGKPEDGICVLGFDEIGMFLFREPAHAWVSMTGGDHVGL